MSAVVTYLPDLIGDRPEGLSASGLAWIFTVVVGLSFAGVAGWCIAHAIRRRDSLPLLLLGGGLISVGLEPVVDTLGKVWYAKDNPWVVYTAMGVPQPAFLLLGYSLFWGGTVYVGSRFVLRGTSLWKVFAVVALMDLFVEYLGAPVLDVGVYYGFSPFNILGFPIWWAFVNGAVSVAGIGLLLVLEPRLVGWRKIGLLAVSPSAFAATHAVCAWPVWVTINSPLPHWVGWIAGCLTIGLALLAVDFLSTTTRSFLPGPVTAMAGPVKDQS